jgi:diguanylate cyclase (GGDEF)-like protein
MSLRLQLNLGLVAALLLALGVAAGAWWVDYEFENHIDQAYNEQVAGTVQLAEAESALWQLRFSMGQFMFGDAAVRQQILENEAKWYALVAGRLDAYAMGRRTRGELEALAVLRAEYARYIESRPRFFELWQAGRQSEALAWRTLTTTPYGAATVAAFERQIALQRTMGEQQRGEALEHVSQARALVIAITAALIALMAIGYGMGRRMLIPIRALQRDAVATVREHFGETLDLSRAGNEVQALELSLQAMKERFTAHTAELTAAREALARQSDYLEGTVTARTAELEHTVARMQRQNREITLRNELGDLLQSCISVDEAGAVIARFAPRLFAGAAGAAYLMTPGAEHLNAAERWGAAPPAEALATTDCWALRRGRAHLVTDDDAALRCPHVAAPLAGAAVCVPLSAHGESLGLLHLVCPEACLGGAATMAEQQQLAEALAAQVGMALANLRLRETLHQQSIRDALTGLYNRRYLEGTLPREISRAQRGGRMLAVFMLDVDHFKKFNDSYGHDAGDAVLKSLGRVLHDSCRQADIACRFGGEEFTLILPDADEAAARDWAERLMHRVRNMEVKAGGQTLPQITISMGLALLPAHGDDPETLLQAADLALYDAKHAGRDRLAVSGEKAEQP